MNLEIISDIPNPLLSRRELEFRLTAKTTPSRKDVLSEIAKAAKAKAELTVIDNLNQKTGSRLIIGMARVYDNPDSMKSIEEAYLSKRSADKGGEDEAKDGGGESAEVKSPQAEAAQAEGEQQGDSGDKEKASE